MRTDVCGVLPATPLVEVARRLVDEELDALPVMDEGEHIVGIVSVSDLLRLYLPQQVQFFDMPILLEGSRIRTEAACEIPGLRARDVMTQPVVCAGPDAPLAKVIGLMLAHAIHQVPIVDEHSLLGLLSRSDVLRALADDLLVGAPGGD